MATYFSINGDEIIDKYMCSELLDALFQKKNITLYDGVSIFESLVSSGIFICEIIHYFLSNKIIEFNDMSSYVLKIIGQVSLDYAIFDLILSSNTDSKIIGELFLMYYNSIFLRVEADGYTDLKTPIDVINLFANKTDFDIKSYIGDALINKNIVGIHMNFFHCYNENAINIFLSKKLPKNIYSIYPIIKFLSNTSTKFIIGRKFIKSIILAYLKDKCYFSHLKFVVKYSHTNNDKILQLCVLKRIFKKKPPLNSALIKIQYISENYNLNFKSVSFDFILYIFNSIEDKNVDCNINDYQILHNITTIFLDIDCKKKSMKLLMYMFNKSHIYNNLIIHAINNNVFKYNDIKFIFTYLDIELYLEDLKESDIPIGESCVKACLKKYPKLMNLFLDRLDKLQVSNFSILSIF